MDLEIDVKSINRLSSTFVVAAILILWLPGCEKLNVPATGRAKQFVELLIVAPHNTARLDVLSAGKAAEIQQGLLEKVPTKVAVEYLRARYRQGVPIRFAVEKISNPEQTHKIVVLKVTPADDGKRNLVLSVNMQKLGGEWFVTRVQREGPPRPAE